MSGTRKKKEAINAEWDANIPRDAGEKKQREAARRAHDAAAEGDAPEGRPTAADSDPLRGLSSADQEIEASNAKAKSVIPRVLPTRAGVYTHSVARALFAPRACRFTPRFFSIHPKSYAIERVSYGTRIIDGNFCYVLIHNPIV